MFYVSIEALKCLGFLSWCRFCFTFFGLLITFINFYCKHLIQLYLKVLKLHWKTANIIIYDSRVSNSIQFVKILSVHGERNTVFFSLAQWLILFLNLEFFRNTRLSSRANPYVVDCPKFRTRHYAENLFFSRTIILWNEF